MSQKGPSAELELANWLRDHHYRAYLTRGSRGPCDIVAFRKSWRGLSKERWLIQVKATNEEVIWLARKKARDLLRDANEGDFDCVFAIRFGRPTRWRVLEFNSVREGTSRRAYRVNDKHLKNREDVFRGPTLL